MKNYILIDDIQKKETGEPGETAVSCHTTVCINNIPRISVIGVLASLLRSIKMDPIEILLYEAKHDSSQDTHRAVEMSPEGLRAIAELRGEDEA